MGKHLLRNHEIQSSKSSTIREKQRVRQRYIDIDKDIGREKK
jgi:hypothetical protein